MAKMNTPPIMLHTEKTKSADYSKVLTNEKRGGSKMVSFERPPLNLFTLRFSRKWFRPHPVRGLKLLSEPCSCHLKSIIFNK
jgi:hypothetical protein